MSGPITRPRFWMAAALGAALLMAGANAAASPRRVLVLALDGLDWDVFGPLAESGRMPNLSRLIARGASGVVRADPPLISPAIWTTIATGVSPARHGIRDFRSSNGRVSSDERASEALWETATASSRTVAVVGWLATWPAESVRGVLVSDQACDQYVESGKFTPADALEGLPPILGLLPHLYLSSGASARYAKRLRRFLPFNWDPHFESRWPKGSPQYARHYLVEQRLAAIFVRDESMTSVARALIARDKPDLAMVHIWGADHVSHGFWRQTFGAATESEKADFGQVIGEYYAYVDEVAGELLKAMGPDVLVLALSDHGFQAWTPSPGDPHPEVSGTHRPEGMFILAGPGVKPGPLPAELRAVDVAPTLTRAMDMAGPEGMEGRVLEEAFEPGALPAPRPPRPSARRLDRAIPAVMAEEEKARLRAMGYLR